MPFACAAPLSADWRRFVGRGEKPSLALPPPAADDLAPPSTPFLLTGAGPLLQPLRGSPSLAAAENERGAWAHPAPARLPPLPRTAEAPRRHFRRLFPTSTARREEGPRAAARRRKPSSRRRFRPAAEVGIPTLQKRPREGKPWRWQSLEGQRLSPPLSPSFGRYQA